MIFDDMQKLDASTHASLAGCDQTRIKVVPETVASTHASLAGCDHLELVTVRRTDRFNSRIPRGMRSSFARKHPTADLLQLTHPSRDAIARLRCKSFDLTASTHASLAGCDRHLSDLSCGCQRLQLTHPSRDAIGRYSRRTSLHMASTHASLAGCDAGSPTGILQDGASTHASLAGCDSAC